MNAIRQVVMASQVAAQLDALERRLLEQLPLAKLIILPWMGDEYKTITLHSIEVDKRYRNQGVGNKALRAITDWADENGYTIILTPQGSKRRLERWYRRHGFVKNRGRNKDFRYRETMYRRPVGVGYMPIRQAVLGYHGEHESTDKDDGTPLWDLTKVYPEDVYEHPEFYYADRSRITWSIVLQAKGKPRLRVKVYRAVPRIKSTEDRILELEGHKRYILRRGRIPRGVSGYSSSSEYYNVIDDLIEELERGPQVTIKRLRINPGDWVTLDKSYATHHGRSNLRNEFKVVTKTVPAKTLFTSGDSIFEWGYHP